MSQAIIMQNMSWNWTVIILDILDIFLGTDVIVALMLDEMAIMKHMSFDGKKYVGGVDLGAIDPTHTWEDDEMPSDALVFMVIAINDSWKLPVLYLDGLWRLSLNSIQLP